MCTVNLRRRSPYRNATDPRIQRYQELYNLPHIQHQEQIAPSVFPDCERNRIFVNVCLGDPDGRIILLRDLTNCEDWSLPGGYVKPGENLVDTAQRTVNRETGYKVKEIQPVVSIQQQVTSSGHETVHEGIGFAAIVDDGQVSSSVPHPIEIAFADAIPNRMADRNKKIVELAQPVIQQKASAVPDHEIESAANHQFGHRVNNHFVSPLIGASASRKVKDTIVSLVSRKPDTILDPACGDDGLVVRFEQKYQPRLCVANDISWDTLEILREQNLESEVIFTNHNILDLPFNITFDLTVFTNTLHHIPDHRQPNVVRQLAAMSEHLVIVDIDDPQNHSLKSKVWNTYYRRILGDQGGSFLNFNEFRQEVNRWLDRDIRFGSVQTIKGRYYYASVR